MLRMGGDVFLSYSLDYVLNSIVFFFVVFAVAQYFIRGLIFKCRKIF